MKPLATSPSPFLQHGATQPVAWLPWGEEAFERARAEGRPILLDIGAVWCHWCHVMDRESYEDPETAALINELYVPVKVDRDERPDVDARYQRAVQAISGQGGWPLTAFLTPDGEVFHGGTYFPPEDAHGRPSFRRVLREVARVWDEERERAERVVVAVRERLTETLTAEAAPGELDPALLDHAGEALAEAFDFRNGGFGRAPKFPNPAGVELMLETWVEDGTDWARRVAEESLLAMARGGFRDHLGGGFHRYSTDARWIIPHFEKMAADNGPLLALYARAAAALESEELREAAEGVVAWVRDVTPDLVEAGGFPASQDADIGFDDDGDYWTWTESEVRAALEDDDAAEAAILHWGVRDTGSAMHLDPGRHVLFRAMAPDDVARRLDRDPATVRDDLARARAALKAARDRRPRPYVDETLYAGWVALMASGHIAAARHLGLAPAGEAGRRAMERVWTQAWHEGRGLLHRVGDDGSGVFLADQAYAADACLDLLEYTGDEVWLGRARALVAVMAGRFAHQTGALRDLPTDAEAGAAAAVLGEPRLDITDSPEPAANAVAALAMARIAALDHDDDALRTARAILRAFAGAAPRIAANAATYFRAVRWVTRPVVTVVVVEEPGTGPGPAPGSLGAAALATYRPVTVVRSFAPGAVDASRLPAPVRAMLTGDAPRAYVCAGRTCAAPVSTPDEVRTLLREFGK